MIKEIQLRINLIEESKEDILLYKSSIKLKLNKNEIKMKLEIFEEFNVIIED